MSLYGTYPIYRVNRRKQVNMFDTEAHPPITNPIVDKELSKAMEEMKGAMILYKQNLGMVTKYKPKL